ncbi:MAG: cytochrome c [Pseudomonadota bacterium]
MKRILTLAAICAAGTMAFAAADDSILQRQSHMKEVGAAAKARDLAALATAGEAALVAFQTDTSGQGTVKTKAADNIWTDWDGFEEIMNTMITSAKAGDADGVFATCKTCHSTYRN